MGEDSAAERLDTAFALRADGVRGDVVGGVPAEVKAPPSGDDEPSAAVAGVIEPFMDAHARRFLHRFAAGRFHRMAALILCRDDVGGLTAYQYAAEMRRQGIVGAGGPPLFLWNLLHTDSAAAHRFNLVQAEELTAFLRETLGRSPGDLAPALAAERRRLAAVHRMEANIGASAGFASINAPSLATTATMGLVALPEMRKHGHSDALASGSVAAGGTIGSLIPPSGMFIIYGILTETSVGDMFAAGIVPGILLALFYMVVIAIRCRLDPAAGPAGPRFGWSERVSGLRRTGDVILLFVLVMGGIIWGWFTPTEAGAMGPSVRWSSQASGGA